MKRLLALLLLVAAAAAPAVAATSFAAKGTTWSAKLTAAQEVPKQKVKNTRARGTFTGTLKGTTLKYRLTFSKLTGPATAAHIHRGAKGKEGPVLLALCGPCKSPVIGAVTVNGPIKNLFAKHKLYVNVHTKKNPNGEIRGQLGT